MTVAATTPCANCERLQAQLDAQQAQLEALHATVAQLQGTVARLQAQLAAARKDSSTSSKPPSSDIVKPPKPQPPPGQDKRKAGGQPGHPKHEPLLGRHRRRLAVLAGVGLPDGAQHEETRRLHVQLLGRLLADAGALLAAAGAELLRLRKVKDHLTPLQVPGQGGAAMFVALLGGLLGAGRRPGPELALGAAAEAVLQRLLQLLAQLGVLGPQPGHLGEQLPDQRLERRHVVGQGRIGAEGGGVHA